MQRSEGLLDVPPLRRLWAAFRELPREGGDVMTHGDLIPGNVLVDGGRLAGVIDVGGLGAADPALDLVAAWHLLDPGPRDAFRADLRCGDLEWARGAAWAFEQAMGLVWYYAETNPAMSHMGRRTLERLTAAGVSGEQREAERVLAVGPLPARPRGLHPLAQVRVVALGELGLAVGDQRLLVGRPVGVGGDRRVEHLPARPARAGLETVEAARQLVRARAERRQVARAGRVAPEALGHEPEPSPAA